MQSTFKHIEDFVAQAGNLAETKAEIFTLKATRKVSATAAAMVTRLSTLVVLTLLLLMLSFGAAFWIGQLVENMAIGFFTIAGFYTLTGLFLFLFGEKLFAKPLKNYFIGKTLT